MKEHIKPALALGISPLFTDAQYNNQWEKLPWYCSRHDGEFVSDWETLHRLGCPVCRERSRASTKSVSLFELIGDALAARGDTLLSKPADLVNDRSTVLFHCSLCDSNTAEQKVADIKRNRRHICAKKNSRAEAFVQQAQDALPSRAADLGYKLIGYGEWIGEMTEIEFEDKKGRRIVITKRTFDQRYGRWLKKTNA